MLACVRQTVDITLDVTLDNASALRRREPIKLTFEICLTIRYKINSI